MGRAHRSKREKTPGADRAEHARGGFSNGSGGAIRALAWVLGVAAPASASIACQVAPTVTTRNVNLHALAGCAPGVPTLNGAAVATFVGEGDFESPSSALAGHPIGEQGEVLSELTAQTRSLVVETSGVDRPWAGESEVSVTGDVDVWMMPTQTSCSCSATVGSREGSALATFGHWALLAGGLNPLQGAIQPSTWMLDVETGHAQMAQPDLLTPRAGASLTPFGSGALVAGGINAQQSVLATAEVFVPDLGGFDQQHFITLSGPRSKHGTAVLATGETLLVGGVGADGIAPLDSMEIVDPVTRTVRAENVARLSVARRSPTVLRLASGEIFVAGGFDALGIPVATLEWFSADASASTKRPQTLVQGSARDYIALSSGGALAVIAPPDGAAADFQSVWVIDRDGTLEAGTPVPGTLTFPILFGSAGGAPALWTGDRWLRWTPWSGAFSALGSLDDSTPHVNVPADSRTPGLALWLDPDALQLALLRFDVRDTFAPLAGPLLVADTTDTAPDRLPGPNSVTFDPSVGVQLAPGATVFVTDRTYADVSVSVDAPTGEPAVVVLRDESGHELEVGGPSCPVPVSSATVPWTVRRMGTTVTWATGSGPSGTCPSTFAATMRVALGLRGPAGAARAVARNVRVTRLGEP